MHETQALCPTKYFHKCYGFKDNLTALLHFIHIS